MKSEGLKARIERARLRIQEKGRLINQNICPVCHQNMQRIQQGPAVIASPCGHLLYHGKA